MDSLDHEAAWWGDCTNTWGEEWKQIEYAKRMGLATIHQEGHYPAWDLRGKTVIDVGGGPVSMLLKAFNAGPSLAVIDPCQYPGWVQERYRAKGITYARVRGEDLEASTPYDECWLYNVLQHTSEPAKVIANAKRSAQTLRIFEWVNIPGDEKHPQVLTQEKLDEWCQGTGATEYGVNGAWGEANLATAWFGVFSAG